MLVKINECIVNLHWYWKVMHQLKIKALHNVRNRAFGQNNSRKALSGHRWRIWGGMGARDMRPFSRSNFFHFHAVFDQKLRNYWFSAQSQGLPPPHVWEILDLPLDALVYWSKRQVRIVADPGFSPGGVRQLPKVLLFFNFFPPKLHENERIWTPGGWGRPWRLP